MAVLSGPTARTASSTSPTSSIRLLEREKVTTSPAAMIATAPASGASSARPRRTQARASAARIPITRYRPRMLGSKKMPFTRKKRL